MSHGYVMLCTILCIMCVFTNASASELSEDIVYAKYLDDFGFTINIYDHSVAYPMGNDLSKLLKGHRKVYDYSQADVAKVIREDSAFNQCDLSTNNGISDYFLEPSTSTATDLNFHITSSGLFTAIAMQSLVNAQVEDFVYIYELVDNELVLYQSFEINSDFDDDSTYQNTAYNRRVHMYEQYLFHKGHEGAFVSIYDEVTGLYTNIGALYTTSAPVIPSVREFPMAACGCKLFDMFFDEATEILSVNQYVRDVENNSESYIPHPTQPTIFTVDLSGVDPTTLSGYSASSYMKCSDNNSQLLVSVDLDDIRVFQFDYTTNGCCSELTSLQNITGIDLEATKELYYYEDRNMFTVVGQNTPGAIDLSIYQKNDDDDTYSVIQVINGVSGTPVTAGIIYKDILVVGRGITGGSDAEYYTYNSVTNQFDFRDSHPMFIGSLGVSTQIQGFASSNTGIGNYVSVLDDTTFKGSIGLLCIETESRCGVCGTSVIGGCFVPGDVCQVANCELGTQISGDIFNCNCVTTTNTLAITTKPYNDGCQTRTCIDRIGIVSNFNDQGSSCNNGLGDCTCGFCDGYFEVENNMCITNTTGELRYGSFPLQRIFDPVAYYQDVQPAIDYVEYFDSYGKYVVFAYGQQIDSTYDVIPTPSTPMFRIVNDYGDPDGRSQVVFHRVLLCPTVYTYTGVDHCNNGAAIHGPRVVTTGYNGLAFYTINDDSDTTDLAPTQFLPYKTGETLDNPGALVVMHQCLVVNYVQGDSGNHFLDVYVYNSTTGLYSDHPFNATIPLPNQLVSDITFNPNLYSSFEFSVLQTQPSSAVYTFKSDCCCCVIEEFESNLFQQIEFLRYDDNGRLLAENAEILLVMDDDVTNTYAVKQVIDKTSFSPGSSFALRSISKNNNLLFMNHYSSITLNNDIVHMKKEDDSNQFGAYSPFQLVGIDKVPLLDLTPDPYDDDQLLDNNAGLATLVFNTDSNNQVDQLGFFLNSLGGAGNIFSYCLAPDNQITCGVCGYHCTFFNDLCQVSFCSVGNVNQEDTDFLNDITSGAVVRDCVCSDTNIQPAQAPQYMLDQIDSQCASIECQPLVGHYISPINNGLDCSFSDPELQDMVGTCCEGKCQDPQPICPSPPGTCLAAVYNPINDTCDFVEKAGFCQTELAATLAANYHPECGDPVCDPSNPNADPVTGCAIDIPVGETCSLSINECGVDPTCDSLGGCKTTDTTTVSGCALTGSPSCQSAMCGLTDSVTETAAVCILVNSVDTVACPAEEDACNINCLCDGNGGFTTQPRDCNDNRECTDDACSIAAGGCVNTINTANTCTIPSDATCYGSELECANNGDCVGTSTISNVVCTENPDPCIRTICDEGNCVDQYIGDGTVIEIPSRSCGNTCACQTDVDDDDTNSPYVCIPVIRTVPSPTGDECEECECVDTPVGSNDNYQVSCSPKDCTVAANLLPFGIEGCITATCVSNFGCGYSAVPAFPKTFVAVPPAHVVDFCYEDYICDGVGGVTPDVDSLKACNDTIPCTLDFCAGNGCRNIIDPHYYDDPNNYPVGVTITSCQYFVCDPLNALGYRIVNRPDTFEGTDLPDCYTDRRCDPVTGQTVGTPNHEFCGLADNGADECNYNECTLLGCSSTNVVPITGPKTCSNPDQCFIMSMCILNTNGTRNECRGVTPRDCSNGGNTCISETCNSLFGCENTPINQGDPCTALVDIVGSFTPGCQGNSICSFGNCITNPYSQGQADSLCSSSVPIDYLCAEHTCNADTNACEVDLIHSRCATEDNDPFDCMVPMCLGTGPSVSGCGLELYDYINGDPRPCALDTQGNMGICGATGCEGIEGQTCIPANGTEIIECANYIIVGGVCQPQLDNDLCIDPIDGDCTAVVCEGLSSTDNVGGIRGCSFAPEPDTVYIEDGWDCTGTTRCDGNYGVVIESYVPNYCDLVLDTFDQELSPDRRCGSNVCSPPTDFAPDNVPDMSGCQRDAAGSSQPCFLPIDPEFTSCVGESFCNSVNPTCDIIFDNNRCLNANGCTISYCIYNNQTSVANGNIISQIAALSPANYQNTVDFCFDVYQDVPCTYTPPNGAPVDNCIVSAHCVINDFECKPIYRQCPTIFNGDIARVGTCIPETGNCTYSNQNIFQVPSPTVTPTAMVTMTGTPSTTVTPTPSGTPTSSGTVTPTSTGTPTPTMTTSSTGSSTPSVTPSASASRNSASDSATPTVSTTSTASHSMTPTSTVSPTPSGTATTSPTGSDSMTSSITPSPTPTVSESATASNSGVTGDSMSTTDIFSTIDDDISISFSISADDSDFQTDDFDTSLLSIDIDDDDDDDDNPTNFTDKEESRLNALWNMRYSVWATEIALFVLFAIIAIGSIIYMIRKARNGSNTNVSALNDGYAGNRLIGNNDL